MTYLKGSLQAKSMSLSKESMFTVRFRLQHPKPEGKQDAT